MRPERVTTVTFDVPGTLVDRDTGVVDWHRAWLRERGRRLDEAAILAAFDEAEQRLHAQHPGTAFAAMLPRIHAELALTWGVDSDESAALDFRDSVRDWPPFADARAGLRTLRGQYRLVALSAIDDWALEQMSRTLGDPFDARLAGDELGHALPDPGFWRQAATRLEASPGEILHCAARPTPDLAGAAGAGLATAWIDRRAGGTPEAGPAGSVDLHVSGLDELIARLQVPAA